MKFNVKRNLLIGACTLALGLSLGFGVANVDYSVNADGQNAYLVGASVSLTDDIVVNVPVTAPEGYTTAKITYGYKGATYTDEAQVVAGEQHVFKFDKITPQNLTEAVSFTLELSGEGKDTITESISDWSIKTYCDALIANKPEGYSDGRHEYLKALSVNLLNYGAKAQIYTEKEGELPTADLSAENIALIGNVSPVSDAGLGGTADASVTWKTATLEFNNKVNLVFTFEATANGEIGFEVDGSTDGVTVTTNGNAIYKAVYNVPVVDFDEVLTLNVTVDGVDTGYELYYSVASYAARIQNNANANDAMKALATATYNYGLAAAEFDEVVDMPVHPYTELGDYLVDCATSSATPTFAHSALKNWTVGVYTDGTSNYNALSAATSDGAYIYGVANAKDAENNTTARVFKIDMSTGAVLGYTEEYDCASQSDPVIWVKDGFVYVKNGAGAFKKIATDAITTSGGAFADATDAPAFVDGEGAAISTIYTVNYNKENDKYLVLTTNNAFVYNGAGAYEKTLSLSTNYYDTYDISGNKFTCWQSHASTTKDYIYLYHKNQGQNVYLQPYITAYDWNGIKISTFVVNQTSVVKTGSGWMKGREAIVVGTDVYSFFSNPQNGNQVAMSKSSVTAVGEVGPAVPYTQFGDFAADYATPSVKTFVPYSGVKPYTAEGKSYPTISASAHGGTYTYFIASGASGERNKDSRLFVIDETSGTIMGYSAEFTAYSGTDGCLFIKDGYAYVRLSDGTFNRISTANANIQGDQLEAATVPTFVDSTGTALASIIDVSYNANTKKYSVLTSNKVYVYGADGAYESEFAIASSAKPESDNLYPGSISSTDDYVYVSYSNSWAANVMVACVNVYDMQGNLVNAMKIDISSIYPSASYRKTTNTLVVGATLYLCVTAYGNSTSGVVIVNPNCYQAVNK